MPFPNEHYHLTFGGPLGVSGEEWSIGLRMSSTLTTDTREAEETALTNLLAALSTAWGQTGSPVGSQAKLTWAKYNRIGLDGKYLRDYTNVLDRAPVGGNTASAYPFQCSLVVTLRTSSSRGLASKGRMFLPIPRWPLMGPDNTLASGEQESALTWVTTLLNGINAAEGSGRVVVASKVREGAELRVRSVDIGSVVDTMRSRRHKLPEIRVAGDLVGADDGGDF